MRRGLDFAWSRPSVADILAGGYSFVCRYLSYDTTGKNLTKAEADTYRAAGIDVVSNWEYATQAPLGGYDQGARDATNAAAQHLACGGGAHDPIYFSVDFDVTEAQQAAVDDYLRGCASVLGLERVGAYGGYYVVKRCFDAGVTTYGWQTYAWSGGQWDPRAHIRQVQNGVTVGGADCDIDEAQQDNFGQWGATMALTDDDVNRVAAAVWTLIWRSADNANPNNVSMGDLAFGTNTGVYSTLQTKLDAVAARVDTGAVAQAVDLTPAALDALADVLAKRLQS